jgi:hypothetical protein
MSVTHRITIHPPKPETSRRNERSEDSMCQIWYSQVIVIECEQVHQLLNVSGSTKDLFWVIRYFRNGNYMAPLLLLYTLLYRFRLDSTAYNTFELDLRQQLFESERRICVSVCILFV